MTQIQGIAKSFGPQVLFDGLHWELRPGRRYGLVGPNGAGKTTLLRIIHGELQPDAGGLVRAKRLRTGYLPQEVERLGEGTVLESVLDGVPGWSTARDALRGVHERMASDAVFAASERALADLDRAGTAFELLGGDALETRARTALTGLGFDAHSQNRPARILSGGWLMRAALARLLVLRPEVLLLDEPTNHLDFESLSWFESFLEAYEGAVVAVSHDRFFLNRFPTHIVELTKRGLNEYPGGYDDFLEGRGARQEQLEAQKARVDRQRAHLERFVERFRAKASKAKQAQSRMKMLARLESVEIDSASGGIGLRFPEPSRTGKEVLVASHVRKCWGDNVVYTDLGLTIYRGDRVALVGPNGAGKSTLLKVLAGVTDVQGGEVRVGSGVVRDYYAQHQLDALESTSSVYEEARRATLDQTVPLIRGVLGGLGFSGQSVEKRVAVLSGGERARLALARMVLRAPNVLLLDEPTNHLDLASREVLENALSQFPGTVVIVSHDRYFINAVANKVLEVEPGGRTTLHLGDYDMYLYRKGGGDPDLIERLLRGDTDFEREAGRAQSGDALQEGEPDAARQRDQDKARKREEAERRNDYGRRLKPLRDQVERMEAQLGRDEARLAEIARLQAEPEHYEDGETVRKLLLEQAALRSTVDAALDGLEEVLQRIEALPIA